jgi:hypothetical protein
MLSFSAKCLDKGESNYEGLLRRSELLGGCSKGSDVAGVG